MPDPITIAAGLYAAGSVASSVIGATSAKGQQRFQKRMSNTAHQREMADLKAGGLNPLLTGKYGGSSTPPGTAFTPGNPAEALPQMATAKAGLKQQKPLVNAQVNQINSATAKTTAEAIAIKQEADRRETMFPLEMDNMIANTELSGTTSAKQTTETRKLALEIKRLNLTSKFYEFLDGATPSRDNMQKFLKIMRVW